MSGVTTSVLAMSRRSSSSGPSTCSAKTRSAVSIFPPASGVNRPSTADRRVAVSKVSWSVTITGSGITMPRSSRSTEAGSSLPPVSSTADRAGKPAVVWAAISPGSRAAARSDGMITAAPSVRRSRMLGSDIAPTMRALASRPSPSRSPRKNRPSQASSRSVTVGARRDGVSGRTNTGVGWSIGSGPGAPARVTTTASSPAWWWASSLDDSSTAAAICAAVLFLPLTTLTTGVPRSAASLALKPNSVGAPTSV